MSNYAAYFAMEKKLKANGMRTDRAELIYSFTNGKHQSLKELSDGEYREFIRWLNKLNTQPDNEMKRIAELRQKRKIIALFCQMGYVANEKPDMLRIHNWCKEYGHLHKDLNGYSGADLTKLVSQAEKVYKSFISTL